MSKQHVARKIETVEGPLPSPVPNIVGQVMVVTLDCGHVRFGNPSMHYKIGAAYNCPECVQS